MTHERDINEILSRVEPWPEADRVALAYQILRKMRIAPLQPAPRDTFSRALGVAAGNSPPPDDETVDRWIQEHRDEKYG